MLGVILARGGSKGLPGKNAKLLLGKPLIQYTIEQALLSESIETVIVSTDDEHIADIARRCGAEVPFMRPSNLSSDTATSVDAIMHAINYYLEMGKSFSHVVLLEPTSPLREAKDIDQSFQQLQSTENATSIVSMVSAVSAHPSFMYCLTKEGLISKFQNNTSSILRRQEISDLYYPEGSIYISEIAALESNQTFYHENTAAFIVPKWKSFEIDDLEDFLITEAIMTANAAGKFDSVGL